MALMLTQPLTETNTRNLLGGKGGKRGLRLSDITFIYEPIVLKMWKPLRLANFCDLTASHSYK
jgi:hypothetical protein